MSEPLIQTEGELRQAGLTLPRWLILAVICLNILVLFIAARGLWSSHQNAVNQAKLALNNLGNVLERNLNTSATVVDFAMQGIADSLESMMREGALRDQAVDSLLDSYDKRHPEVGGFRIAGQDGRLMWGKGIDRTQPMSIADRDYFIQLKDNPAGSLIVTPPLIGKLTQQPVIAFARAFRSPDGRFAGVLTATIPIEYFNRLLADVFLGTRGIAAIRHQDFSLVTVYPPPTNPNVVVGTRKISGELKELLEGGARRGEYRTANAPDGVDRLYSFRQLEQFPLLVIAGLSPGEYLGNWYEEARNTAILVVAIIILSFFSTRLLIRFWRQKSADFQALKAQELRLREMLEAQAESEARFRLMFDDAPDAYLILGLKDGIFRLCNRAAARLLGCDPAQILGMTPQHFSPEVQPDGRTSKASVGEKVRAALDKGYHRFEWVHRRVDGTDFWAEVALAPGVYGGEKVLFAVWRDISDRKQTEFELQDYRTRLERMVEERTADLMVAKDAAEAASRAKTAFLSMASHELRTPMNGVMGTLNLAMKHTEDPKLLDYLAKADRASRQLLSIINDVLDISRIESAKLMLATERFSLGEIRQHVLDAVETIAQAKGLQLTYTVHPELDTRVFLGDPLRLTQILINLVGNAVKFTETGQVSVALSEQAGGAPGSVRLRFEVQDSGVGISPEDQGRIFEPFEQSRQTANQSQSGTGLGLALCKRLVDAMGGRIGVHSAVGSGSLFWFEIDFAAAPAGSDAEHQGDAGPGDEIMTRHRGASILLVDDEPLNLEITQAILEDVGLNVFTAQDGVEAVECAKAGGFDLILMDMNMPRMGGIEATYQIREIATHSHTPIVAMTANAFVEDREACLQAGMNDHIGKPVMPEVLYKTLLRWLDRKKGL